jgi:hypothetical protein
MVKKDKPIVDVCVTTKGQRVKIPKVDTLVEELPKREVSPIKGRRIKWEKEKSIHKDVVNKL